MEKKKILHVVEAFGGGVYTFLLELSNNLGNDFEILIAYSKRSQTPENFKEQFNSNIKFIEVENFTRNINPIKDLKAFMEVQKIVKEEKPDIVHMHSSKAGIIGRLAISSKGRKLFYTPHGYSFLKQDDSKFKRGIYKAIEKIATIYKKKCKIIACSEGEYEEALKLTKCATYINNGINCKEIEEMIKHNSNINKTEGNTIKICTVGRIGFQKNPELFNEIAKKFPEQSFTWIGDGELKDKLTSPNIQVTGWAGREEVLNCLAEQDIFILPSLWEGLPISLLEAMYLGKICIVSNVIGNRDVIKNGENGFVCDSLEDYISVINNIKELQSSKIEKIKKLARKDVMENYNINKMSEEYNKIYNKKPVILHIVNSNIYSGLEKVAIQIIEETSSLYDSYYVTKNGKITETLDEKSIKRIYIKRVGIKEVKKVVKEYNPQIIHAHDFTTTIISALSFIKVPIISHIHNNPLWIRKFNMYTIIFLLSSFKFKKLLTVSDSIEKEYIFSKLLKSKIYNISNPLSRENIINKVDMTNNNKTYDICFVGRLTEQKNPIAFINIVGKIKKQQDNLKVIMIGDGELKTECIKKIKELDLGRNIELAGFKKNPYQDMYNSKLFCLTSKWEGFGLVAFEALTLGIPSIVSNVGGLVDIVDDEVGKLCCSNEDFSNEIIDILLKQGELKNKSLNAINKSLKLENYEKYMKQIKKLYIEVNKE